MRQIDPMFEERHEAAAPVSSERPIGFLYHFIEMCGGAGRALALFLHSDAWSALTSTAYDLASTVVLDWLVHMLTSGRLDAMMVEPPCTTFSSAAYPPCRSYTQPRGFFPLQEKALLGNILALRALLLLHFCTITGALG